MESYKWLIAYKKGDKWYPFSYAYYFNKIDVELQKLYVFSPEVEQITIKKVSR